MIDNPKPPLTEPVPDALVLDSDRTCSATDAASPARTENATTHRAHLTTRLGPFAIQYSGLMGIALLVVVYTLWLPHIFFTEITLKTIIANQAIIGILALAALIPLVAGLIDLSFGAVAGLSLVLTVYLSLHSSWSIWVIGGIGVLAAALCGVVSGLLVAIVRLDSFIVTLGTSSVALGLAEFITKGNALYGKFGNGFVRLGQDSVGPIPYLTGILVLLGILVWIWHERTPAGRYTMAVGSNPVAARLAGISVPRTQILTLTISAVIAGLAGVLLAAEIGNGSTTTGPGYLLPVIAGLFLGSTQVKNRPNVVGTLIAIFLLGTGIKGLQLAGAANWATDTFNGAVLLLAVSAAALRSRRAATKRA